MSTFYLSEIFQRPQIEARKTNGTPHICNWQPLRLEYCNLPCLVFVWNYGFPKRNGSCFTVELNPEFLSNINYFVIPGFVLIENICLCCDWFWNIQWFTSQVVWRNFVFLLIFVNTGLTSATYKFINYFLNKILHLVTIMPLGLHPVQVECPWCMIRGLKKVILWMVSSNFHK